MYTNLNRQRFSPKDVFKDFFFDVSQNSKLYYANHKTSHFFRVNIDIIIIIYIDFVNILESEEY